MGELVNIYFTRYPSHSGIDFISITDQSPDGFKNYQKMVRDELDKYTKPAEAICIHSQIDADSIDWRLDNERTLLNKIDEAKPISKILLFTNGYVGKKEKKPENLKPDLFDFDGKYRLIDTNSCYRLNFLKDYGFTPTFGSNWDSLERDLSINVPIYLDNRSIFPLGDKIRSLLMTEKDFKPISISEFNLMKFKQEALDFWFLKDRPEELLQFPQNRLSKELVMALGRHSPLTLAFMQPEKIPASLLDELIRKNGSVLVDFPDEKAITKERVITAINSQDEGAGILLKYLDQEDRTKDLCRKAVATDGLALQFVPEEHRDIELCQTALSKAWDFDGDHLGLLYFVPHPEIWLRNYIEYPDIVGSIELHEKVDNFNIYTAYREIEKTLDPIEPIPFDNFKNGWEAGTFSIDIGTEEDPIIYTLTINQDSKEIKMTYIVLSPDDIAEDIEIQYQDEDNRFIKQKRFNNV